MVSEGLKGVVAAESEMSFIDGEEGVLIYRGYNIHDLARNITFEELLPLFWFGELPNEEQLDRVRGELAEHRAVDDQILGLTADLAESDLHPMAALRTIVSALAAHDPESEAPPDDPKINRRKARRITSKFITIIAAYDRLRNGKDPVDPDPDLSHAANFLYMLNGERPTDKDEEIFDTCLILHADHGFNASTFSARVTASTLSDLHSAITTAIGTLKGPLHGGANSEVMKMLLEIDEREIDPVDYVKEKLDAGEKVMGFGHRVYRTEDPRATHLREYSEQLGEQNDTRKWFDYSRAIEDYLVGEKGINSNVDFYSASTYYQLGIPIDLYTTIFASSRVVGWIGHVMEQYAANTLIRPRAKYVGPRDKQVVSLEDR